MRQLMKMRYLWLVSWLLFVSLVGFTLQAAAPPAAETLVWNKKTDRVDADVRALGLGKLLERIASETGWQVYAEPGMSHTASAKFKDLPSKQALRFLLGDLNFALVPQTNTNLRLYVFRTEMKNATRRVRAFRHVPGSKRIPNELIVQLKPGADINELARRLGATVVGCIEKLHVCRLRFPDADAADAARAALMLNDAVTALDYNYSIPRPNPQFGVTGASAPQLSLQLNPPPETGQIVIGLVDTSVQPLCGDLNKFVRTPISVAGQAHPAADTPTHATGMLNTILGGLQAATKGSTSVQILPVDVYGPNASTSSFDVASGIVAAVNNGATIINLSLGGQSDSAFLGTVIQAVQARGIPVVAAAGNEPVTTPFYPAAYPGVLAVTAVENGQIAPYANRGSFVNVAAPDSGVFCFNGQPFYVQGTSTSAAYTSGTLAGTAEVNGESPSQAASQVQQMLPVPSGP